MRALTMLGAFALAGCNLIFGLEDAADRPGGASEGGGGPGAGAPGGAGPSGASDPNGGGGSDPTGGSGGGSGGCPPEQPAGPGTELTPNGSFEDGSLDWVASGLAGFSVVDAGSACGCRAARVLVGSGYGELRGLLAPPSAANVHARARVKASDLVAVGLMLRVNNEPAGPAPDFPPDAADGEVDGWRTVEQDWVMTDGASALLAIQVDGSKPTPPNSEILVDCVSLVVTE